MVSQPAVYISTSCLSVSQRDEQLASKREDFHTALRLLPREECTAAVWTSADANRLRHILDACAHAKCTRAFYLQRLRLEFPERSEADLIRRDQYCALSRAHRQRKRDIMAKWMRY